MGVVEAGIHSQMDQPFEQQAALEFLDFIRLQRLFGGRDDQDAMLLA